jgi:threonine dehydratase
MAAGIAALVKSIDPSILVIGVEPTGANKMAISLKTGRRVSLDKVVRVVISPVLQCVPSSNSWLDIVCTI